MTFTRSLLLLLAALAVLVAAGCGGEEGVPNGAVAVVDGETITTTDLDALLARIKKTYKANKQQFPKAGTPEYQSLQSQAVAHLVQRIEYEKEAGEFGVKVSDSEVDKRIATIRKENFGNSQKRLEQQMKQQGYTLAVLKEDVRYDLLSNKLYKEITEGIKVRDGDVRKYYDQNKQQYTTPESRELRHILVKTRAEANRIYDQLKAGGDFTQLAKQKSLDPGSKDNGGKLTVSRGQTVPPFDQTAFLLPTNTISRAVKTEFGFHIIQPLSAIKPAKTTPFPEVKATIRSQLQQERTQKAVTDWAAKVQREYDKKVKYADGFAPPKAATEPGTTSGSG
jgi:foldase protein PrsA